MTYVPYGNSEVITLFSDSTFSYDASFGVGDSPETFGNLSFNDDTIYFNYNLKIHPEILDFSSRLNPSYDRVNISLGGNISWHHFPYLQIKDSASGIFRTINFDSNYNLILDSLKETDRLFVHIGMYSSVPIFINPTAHNEFNFQIQLPETETIYFLTQEKALVKNGFLYFSFSEDDISYFNKDVYSSKKERKKIYEFLSEKYFKAIKNK